MTPADAGRAGHGAARRGLALACGGLGAALIAISAAWWAGEARWAGAAAASDEAAFADGSLGLETAPLKYILVAPSISEAALGDDWPRRFGFLKRDDAVDARCAAASPRNLPVGFNVSRRLPGNAAPIPVEFVGLTCAACHSAAPAGKVILGAGSQTADVIAFTDAFTNAVLDRELTADKILEAYDAQCPAERPSGPVGALNRRLEAFLIDQWLDGARTQFRSNAAKYDLAFHDAELADPRNIPTGPSRTRPFRSVVRNTLDFPGAGNVAYSKVPLAGMQGLKRWSQFDGSIADPTVRSLIAVFTSGSTVAALDDPVIASNVERAARYTLTLGVAPRLQTLAEAFPDRPRPDRAALDRGRSIYMTHCDGCHGHPEPSGWDVGGARSDQPSITPVEDVGTDPARLGFRYADMLPAALASVFPLADVAEQRNRLTAMSLAAARDKDIAAQDWWERAVEKLDERSRQFPAGHRRAFSPDEIARRRGYQNAPMPFMWLRAPYLHNASVPTLRQLIGLEARPAKFCRGGAGYDPIAIGVAAPAPDAQGRCDSGAGFLFDASAPGNSNAGHAYPPPGAVGPADLEALLAYLGTL